MATFDGTSARRAVADLIGLRAGALTDGRYEIQDDGEFVLLTAELTADMSKPALAELCECIKQRMSSVLPLRRKGHAWMVILRRHGATIDSVLPEMLL